MAKRRQQYSRSQLEQMADRIAHQQGVPPALFRALIQQESGWRTDDPTSTAGAQGLTQLMPGTARGLGVRDVMDPAQNLRGGARYLRKQLDAFGNNPRLALSAYNSGPGGAESGGAVESFPETQAYVRNVMALEQQYAKMGVGSGGMSAGMPPLPETALPGDAGVDPAAAPEPGLSERPLGAGAPSFGDLIARVGPQSAAAVDQVQTDQASQPQTGDQPTMAPGDAGPDVQTDGGSPAVGGLNAEFARRFGLLQKAVQQAGGDLTIYSGGRTPEKQAVLYQNALQKYGSESEARKWVAPPGKSNHDTHAGLKHGLGDGALASDLRGDLAMAHQLAGRYGLKFPLANEAWHVELAGIR